MGVSLLFVFVVLPLTILLLLVGIYRKSRKITLIGCLPFFLFCCLLGWVYVDNYMHRLHKREVYGTYVVDRSQFPGRQSNWQYHHFRMEIGRDDTLRLYLTEQDKIIRTYKRPIRFVPMRVQALWQFDDSDALPTHHLIAETPTLYRKGWKFYYVFNSVRFRNVFFKKGTYKKDRF